MDGGDCDGGFWRYGQQQSEAVRHTALRCPTGGKPLTVVDVAAQRPNGDGDDITFVTRWPRSAAFA
ncbi:hypothetical protein [Pectobacterium odoriferum]|uniref:hypothetical protein n=1 Tax=Pectobacterium odoriferum TaxID=78398 RepID=UPI000D46807B|nr:hypothetical protein [Pectobacterium odoriferum]POD95159.1 hypothetical protein BV925_03430 [Pectobacterium odoriferum]POE04615.1 hypothetical protein BV916_11720 [Pectobacterium odoriferum]